jgi:transcriptional regulator with GAF, ATPase, and Fis domain
MLMVSMDFIFETLPASRVALLVNRRPTQREPQDFIAEVFGERGVAGPVRFTPRAEAIESVFGQGKLYVSPDSPRIVCAPVIMPDGVRGTVYFESTGADPDFRVEETQCIQLSATIVGSIIARAEEIRLLEKNRILLNEKLRRVYKMVGDGPAMRALQGGMRNAAAGDGPVLILGESGTGKELIAFGIHDMSSRGGLAFMPLQCLNTGNSRLREAFLGDRASFDGPPGTVFLKEISALALPAQKELLQILQHEKPEVRLMASTQLDLDQGFLHNSMLVHSTEHAVQVGRVPLLARKEAATIGVLLSVLPDDADAANICVVRGICD